MLEGGELERGEPLDALPLFLLFFFRFLSFSSFPLPIRFIPRSRRCRSRERGVHVGAGCAAAGARGVEEHRAHRVEPLFKRVELQEIRDLGSDDRGGPGALGGAPEGLEPGRVAVEGEDAAFASDES